MKHESYTQSSAVLLFVNKAIAELQRLKIWGRILPDGFVLSVDSIFQTKAIAGNRMGYASFHGNIRHDKFQWKIQSRTSLQSSFI